MKFDPWSVPNPYPMYSPEALAYSSRKLAHYNEWLCDKSRAVGSGPYPGFPEDLERLAINQTSQLKGKKMQAQMSTPEVAAAVINSVVATITGTAEVPEAAKPIKRKGKPPASERVKGVARAGSKLEQAIAIYTRLNGDKAATIAAIQSEAGMSQAGATTYFYNAKKAIA